MTIEKDNEYPLSLAIEQVMLKLQSVGAYEDESPWGDTFASLAILLVKTREEEELENEA